MSKITGGQIAMTDTIIRTSVVLGELPKHDRDRVSTWLWKDGANNLLDVGLHKPSIYKQ